MLHPIGFWSQSTGVLKSESMHAAISVAQSLNLDSSASAEVLRAALPFDACLAHWKSVQDSVETLDIPESELFSSIRNVQKELGACRRARSQAMRKVIPEELKQPFDQLADPGMPQVLHFGMHNRLDCTVCKPSNPNQ